MNFTWVCIKYGELVNLDAFASLPEVHYEPNKTEGCFGSGPGRLQTSNTSYTFNNSMMSRGSQYSATLIAQKGKQRKMFTQTFFIAEAPPNFNVRYADHPCYLLFFPPVICLLCRKEHKSINPSVSQSVSQPINEPVNQSINQSISQPISQSTSCQSISQSVSQSVGAVSYTLRVNVQRIISINLKKLNGTN